MTLEPGRRPSDTDRLRAMTELTEHLGSGRLGPTEFECRCAAVAAATDRVQLAELFADLPRATPPAPQPLPRRTGLRRAAVLVATTAAAMVVAVTGNWVWLIPLVGVVAVVLTRICESGHRPPAR
ncbi:DUF1707 SHOCT-like domain-containing protein [Nocardia neocaledoniensis]|uniref:DUF1707 SHOCT-like domain-containing protein n=1 Tax=Nocardia neocaledoniensis TaxID=236511 RepID=UPI000D717300